MFIDLENPDGTLIDRVEVKADTVPRVGEEIRLPEESKDLGQNKRLVVIEVYHQLDDGLMEAVVRCRTKE